MSSVFTEAGRWKLREEGRRKKKQAIKSQSLCLLIMTDPDLGSGLPSLSCSCSEEKHGTIISGSLGFSLVAPNHLSFLVFQQEEECQRIPQPAEGKRLSKRPLCLFFSYVFLHTLVFIKTQKTFRLTLWAAAVCAVGVWWSERDGLIEEGAGGGAEA